MNKIQRVIKSHYERIWGRKSTPIIWGRGPINELPDFSILSAYVR